MSNHTEKTEDLLDTVRFVLGFEKIPNLRAIEAWWNDNLDVLYLKYYHDGPLTDDLEYDLNTIGAEILAQYHDELIDDTPIRIDYDQPLPDSTNLILVDDVPIR